GLAISSAVSAAHTAFLSQGAAFVSAPTNAQPDSEGSGIWSRAVGGNLTTNSNTSVSASWAMPERQATMTGSMTCSTQFHQNFGGFQLGHDVARLNVGGWNLTFGTTAGFLETSGFIVGGGDARTVGHYIFNSTTQAPFAGTYAAATYGNFFI